MNYLLDDDIDFGQYLDLTAHDVAVRPASFYIDDVVAHFHDYSAPLGAKTPWQKVGALVRFRSSEVTVWTGYNGHGKSLALGMVALGFVAQGQKICIASMEMLPKVTLARMARQAYATSKPDAEDIRDLFETTANSVWLYDQQGMVNSEKVVGVVNYAARELGCQHFIIDSLLKCGFGEDDYNGQKSFVDRLCTVARDTGIHIHLVCHSRKGKDEMTPPGKMDVRGASSITDQADNVICTWRNKAKEHAIAEGNAHKVTNDPDALLDVCKQRNGEWEGRIKLWFDAASLQYVENQAGPRNILNPRMYEST